MALQSFHACENRTSMRRFSFVFVVWLAVVAGTPWSAQETVSAAPWATSARIDQLVEEELANGTMPGAVVIVGRGPHNILHRQAYGLRARYPRPEPMTVDTIFDCASLTKVVATTTVVMQLIEEGKLRLGDRVTKHLPEFMRGNSRITIQHLLTHFSGLRPDVDIEPEWSGYDEGLRRAYAEIPRARPGQRFIYSDINFILLAEIVHKIEGKPLDQVALDRLFGPLRMKDTAFVPDEALRPRIAPTERLDDGTILRGVVHDPTTRFMGGVSGHAGMFSTADDLARFAQMLLSSGNRSGVRILSPLSVVRMTTPQSPAGNSAVRGLGWDLNSPFASVRGDLFPVGSFGHTGFTGTSLWIDPESGYYVVLMTNRVHPNRSTSVVALRAHLASVVAASIESVDTRDLRRQAFSRAGIAPAGRAVGGGPVVMTGLDVLVEDEFAPLQGKRVGLITNHTGIDRVGRRNIDLFHEASGVELAAIFSPEHGVVGALDEENVADTSDTATGVRVWSLYKPGHRRPTAEMLAGLDALVFDVQDIGARFYTYTTTMAYAMEAAAEHGLAFYVLDRPNPIGGDGVDGPIVDDQYESFIGYLRVPLRHGMTAGELARFFAAKTELNLDLTVVPAKGWQRDMWFDETGLRWVNPSPNMRTLEQALLYPGVAMLEGLSNVSVGRGTDTPFEWVGADWVDGQKLASILNAAELAGLRFYAARRTPESSRFAGKEIDGVQIVITNRDVVEPVELGIHLAAGLRSQAAGRIRWAETERLIGDESVLSALADESIPARQILGLSRADLGTFLGNRAQYLLY